MTLTRTVATKVCRKCKKPKALASFGVDNAKPDGLRGDCDDCRDMAQKAQRLAQRPDGFHRDYLGHRQRELEAKCRRVSLELIKIAARRLELDEQLGKYQGELEQVRAELAGMAVAANG